MNINAIVEPALPATIDVIVIGYGPVGAALAALLGRYGVSTLVIDKATDIMMMPRAIALDNEALRILQMVGLDDNSLERIGIQQVKMHCPLVGEFGQISAGGAKDGHPKLVTFYQPDLEKVLRARVTASRAVTVKLGCELTSLENTDDGVIASINDSQGQSIKVSAKFAVGADGASSKVRHLISQEFEGETYAQDWLIVDAIGREGKAIDHIEFLCDPVRPTVHMPAPGGRERWEFMLQPGEAREEMERPEKLAELLSRWAAPGTLNIERHAVYRFHARCCKSFQKGRVFLAGDAAHVTPPFVGQGLVAGLRDVANLGWKLAWAARGLASPAILDSYTRERQPHARKMINLARLMGHMVMPKNHLRAALLHGAFGLAGQLPLLRHYIEDMGIKPRNEFSEGLFAKARRRGGLGVGRAFPQAMIVVKDAIVPSDGLLDDGLTIVGIGVDPRQFISPAQQKAWEGQGGRFVYLTQRGQIAACDIESAEALGNEFLLRKSGGWLVAVRPDRVIMNEMNPVEGDAMVLECLRLLA